MSDETLKEMGCSVFGPTNKFTFYECMSEDNEKKPNLIEQLMISLRWNAHSACEIESLGYLRSEEEVLFLRVRKRLKVP